MRLILLGCFLLVSFFLLTNTSLAAPIVAGSFSTTWKTDNPGTSDSDQIAFYLGGDGDTCAVSLYWEEVGNASNNGTVVVDSNCNGTAPLTFPTPGTYRVDISGSFATLSLSSDEQKIITVEQWGDNVWERMSRMFEGATNLVSNASDVPNLSAVTDMSFMFLNAENFNSDVSDWDVSDVRDMRGVFQGASSFNQSLDSWNVSNVRNFTGMFSGASAFNQPINSWNVSNVNWMGSMFSGASAFNQPLNSWDVSEVTDMDQMFAGASSFNQSLNNWDLSEPCPLLGFNFWNFFFSTAYACIGGSFNMEDIFIGTALSSENYAAILQAWSELSSIPQNENLGTVPSTYCDTAQAARDTLINENGWTITDLGPVACIIEDEESGGNNTATRVGARSNTDTVSVDDLPEPDESTLKNFFASVRQLIDYMRMNEEEVRNLTPEETTKLIITLRDALLFILNLVPGV